LSPVPDRSDLASPKRDNSKEDSKLSKGVDQMGLTGQISNKTGESNNLGITG
tara:strand:+ start:407 stop:562 length:156 start_codon:yes stop_codon:yes gene_type:complete